MSEPSIRQSTAGAVAVAPHRRKPSTTSDLVGARLPQWAPLRLPARSARWSPFGLKVLLGWTGWYTCVLHRGGAVRRSP